MKKFISAPNHSSASKANFSGSEGLRTAVVVGSGCLHDGLTDEEKQSIDEMLTRISTKVLRGHVPIDGQDVDANKPASDKP